MTDLASLRSPFGLGWARRLALANAPPDISVREAFDRQLFAGVLTTATGMFTLGAIIAIPVGTTFDVISGVVPCLVFMVLLLAFLSRAGRVSAYAHVMLAFMFPMPLFSAIGIGGTLGWLGLASITSFPVFAAVLTGSRGALLWTALSIASLGAYALSLTVGFRPFELEGVEGWLAPGIVAMNMTFTLLFQMLAVTWFLQQRDIVDDLLADERKRAEGLLHNVMPSSIATRLQRGEVIADHFDEVTVVFADLVGFTTLSANLPPRRVVAMLTEVFGEIDRIATEEGMEKVKTIGDCYMAVAGAPEAADDHADRALRFATRVRDRVVGWTHYGTALSVRIGVHSGPVMAGILGNKRILYDLWGDTVNAASRLESSGVAGEVQVSEPTVRLLSSEWDLEDRGVVQLRGRAGMRSFIVRQPKVQAKSSAS